MPKRTGLSIKCPHCDGTGRMPLERASVGEMILSRRKALGMTQEELAGKVQKSRAQIANMEGGRSDMPIKTLIEFARALQCTPKEPISCPFPRRPKENERERTSQRCYGPASALVAHRNNQQGGEHSAICQWTAAKLSAAYGIDMERVREHRARSKEPTP